MRVWVWLTALLLTGLVRAVEVDDLLAALRERPEAWMEIARDLKALSVEALPALLAECAPDAAHAADAQRLLTRWVETAQGERRAALTAALAKVVATGAETDLPLALKARFVPLVGRLGGDSAVPHLVALLDDPLLREAARQALVQIPGVTSLAALRQAAAQDDADREWGERLLHGLGRRGDHEALPRLLALLDTGRPSALRMACDALARVGDGAALAALERLWANPDRGVREAAIDAALRLATSSRPRETTAERVAQWLAGDLAPHERCAALTALVAQRGVGAVDDLTTALGHASVQVRAAAAELLSRLSGPGVVPALASSLVASAPAAQVVLIRELARRQGTTACQALAPLLVAPDTAVRRAAIEALGTFAQTDVAQALLARARAETGDLRWIAGRAALAVARRVAGKDAVAAALLLKQVLGVAQLVEEQVTVLQALESLARPDLREVLLPYLDRPLTRSPAGRALLTIGDQLAAAGRRDEAEALYRRLATVDDGRLPVLAAGRLAALGVFVEPARDQGFLTRWWLIGPFPNVNDSAVLKPFFPEQAVDLNKTHLLDGEPLRWRLQPIADRDGVQNLLPVFDDVTDVCAYAYTEFTMPAAQDALLRIGSDDGVVVWLNENQVHRHIVRRALVLDQDTVKVRLRPGRNRLLLKVLQGEGAWGYTVRLSRPDGTPLLLAKPQGPTR